MARTLFIISILVLTAIASHAQQNSIVGTWHLNFSESIGLMDIPVRQKFDSIDQVAKTRIESSMADREFIFGEGGNVTINWTHQSSAKTSTGTWSVNGDTLVLIIEGDVQNYTFEKGNNHLIMRSTIPSGLFSNLYLTSQL